MSVIWILYRFITIILGLGINSYALYKLFVKIDSFIDGHISFNPNIINNLYITDISDNSIEHILINLQIINSISLIVSIFLLLLIMLKFYFNKNIGNIAILLILFILIVTLALTTYIYSDLYANLENFIKIYISIKSK